MIRLVGSSEIASSGALTYLGILKDGVNGVDGLDAPHNIAYQRIQGMRMIAQMTIPQLV